MKCLRLALQRPPQGFSALSRCFPGTWTTPTSSRPTGATVHDSLSASAILSTLAKLDRTRRHPDNQHHRHPVTTLARDQRKEHLVHAPCLIWHHQNSVRPCRSLPLLRVTKFSSAAMASAYSAYRGTNQKKRTYTTTALARWSGLSNTLPGELIWMPDARRTLLMRSCRSPKDWSSPRVRFR